MRKFGIKQNARRNFGLIGARYICSIKCGFGEDETTNRENPSIYFAREEASSFYFYKHGCGGNSQ